MQDGHYIIEKLGIEDLAPAAQEEILIQVRTLIGEAITEGLSEQQLNEYEAIINANDSVIQSWLAQHAPEYKNSPVYQAFEAGYHDDPERNDPAKLFANLAWVELNVPDKQSKIDMVIDDYKRHLGNADE